MTKIILENLVENVIIDLASNITNNLIHKTKDQLLKEVFTPKYAKLMKDFTKDQILHCILPNYPDIIKKRKRR
jgi:hypothetical protein